MEGELKASDCPFCGTQPMVRKLDGGDWEIICNTEACVVRPAITGFMKRLALNRWNRRAPLPDAERRRIRAEAIKEVLTWAKEELYSFEAIQQLRTRFHAEEYPHE